MLALTQIRHKLLLVGLIWGSLSSGALVAAIQSSLADSVFSIEDVNARSPAGNHTDVSGAGVHVSRAATYDVKVQFEVAVGASGMETFRRVKLYHSVIHPSNCKHKECWLPLHQFSMQSGDTEFTLTGIDFSDLMVTSWSTDFSRNRAGRIDRFQSTEEVTINGRKGVTLKFVSRYGVTFVTISPV